ncbi:MAG: DUF4123 domain-containing protein, partial [Paracoccaceae bacterium]
LPGRLMHDGALNTPGESRDAVAVTLKDVDWSSLLAHNAPPLWAVIDGVNCRDVSDKTASDDVQSTCLYTSADPSTRMMAPWLVRIEPDGGIVDWLAGLPQDQHWGILLQSHATLRQLRAHLRKYTMLWTPADAEAPVYFRFYDPRVALDMMQAIEPWKLARFFKDIGRLILPVTPLMLLPENAGLAPAPELDAKPGDYGGRLISVTPDDARIDDGGPSRAFRIGHVEYARFGALQKRRSNMKMARELLETYPDRTAAETLEAVEAGGRIGKPIDMISVRQIRALARCVLEFGFDFAANYGDAATILDNPTTAPWRKCDLLEQWIPRGRIRRDLLAEIARDEQSFPETIRQNAKRGEST